MRSRASGWPGESSRRGCSAIASASTWRPAWPACSPWRRRSGWWRRAAGSCRPCLRAPCLPSPCRKRRSSRCWPRSRSCRSPPSTPPRWSCSRAPGRRSTASRPSSRAAAWSAAGCASRTPSIPPWWTRPWSRSPWRWASSPSSRRGSRFLSNVSGTWITPDEATDPDYWVRHLREHRPLFRRPGGDPARARGGPARGGAAAGAGRGGPAAWRRGPRAGPFLSTRRRRPARRPGSPAPGFGTALGLRRAGGLDGLPRRGAPPARAPADLPLRTGELLDRAGASAAAPG